MNTIDLNTKSSPYTVNMKVDLAANLDNFEDIQRIVIMMGYVQNEQYPTSADIDYEIYNKENTYKNQGTLSNSKLTIVSTYSQQQYQTFCTLSDGENNNNSYDNCELNFQLAYTGETPIKFKLYAAAINKKFQLSPPLDIINVFEQQSLDTGLTVTQCLPLIYLEDSKPDQIIEYRFYRIYEEPITLNNNFLLQQAHNTQYLNSYTAFQLQDYSPPQPMQFPEIGEQDQESLVNQKITDSYKTFEVSSLPIFKSSKNNNKIQAKVLTISQYIKQIDNEFDGEYEYETINIQNQLQQTNKINFQYNYAYLNLISVQYALYQNQNINSENSLLVNQYPNSNTFQTVNIVNTQSNQNLFWLKVYKNACQQQQQKQSNQIERCLHLLNIQNSELDFIDLDINGETTSINDSYYIAQNQQQQSAVLGTVFSTFMGQETMNESQNLPVKLQLIQNYDVQSQVTYPQNQNKLIQVYSPVDQNTILIFAQTSNIQFENITLKSQNSEIGFHVSVCSAKEMIQCNIPMVEKDQYQQVTNCDQECEYVYEVDQSKQQSVTYFIVQVQNLAQNILQRPISLSQQLNYTYISNGYDVWILFGIISAVFLIFIGLYLLYKSNQKNKGRKQEKEQLIIKSQSSQSVQAYYELN